MKCLIFLINALQLLLFVASAEGLKSSYKNLLKPQTILTQSTEVAALGRVADLGDLYDARSDNFIEISLYTSDLSGDAIHSVDNAYSDIDYVRAESFSEKTEKLGVSGSLSVSFLCGMVSGSGSAKYLNEDKKSAKSAKTSLVYSIRTVREDLKIFSKTSRNLIDPFLLENIDATHVVVGIEWGANVVLSLEETNTDSSNIEEIQGELKAALDIAVLSVSGSADVDFGNSNVEKSSTFSLHLFGDIIPNTVPQTINESVIFIRNIPDLIKNENNGKGKIMKYILMPLPTVQKVVQPNISSSSIVKDIDQELIDQFMQIFQEMKDSELEINDVYSSFSKWKLMIPESEFEMISEVKSKFEAFTNDLKAQFANSVAQFRNDDLDEDALISLMTSYKNSNWTYENVNKFLDDVAVTMEKVRLMNLFQSFNAKFIDRRFNKNQILSNNYEEELRIISMDLSMDISSPYIRDIVRLLKAESGKESGAIKYYIQETSIAIPEVKVYLEGIEVNSFPVDKKEYILLKDQKGKVTVIDAKSYEQIISYDLPGTLQTIAAVVGDKFYNINLRRGIITSTSLEKIMSPSDINWAQVGSFPAENWWVSNGAVINGTFIYFVTCHGVLYSFDTVLKTVTKAGNVVDEWGAYASLIVVDNILYIHKHSHFYSFDGASVKEISTSETRYYSGLFQFGSLICRVGGNGTDVGLKPDLVSCYNPGDGKWITAGYVNEYRRYPGITTTELGTYIFGGLPHHAVGDDGNWLDSVEVFNPETKIWSFVPSPLTVESEFIQAVKFYYKPITLIGL